MKNSKKTQQDAAISQTIDAVLNQRLYPYQQTWMRDQSRFKIGLWARQTGKDFTCAAEAVVDCLLHPGTQWLIIACAERQAMESLQKVKDWAAEFGCEAEGNLSQVRFANGSRIIALPARPASIRGYSANLILTEFAFHDDPEAVWRAAFPIITNPGGGRDKKVRIISTPNGQANLFHRLWTSSAYSKHFVSIHQAIAQGLPLNATELQTGLGDAEAWRQEYECQFIDSSAVLFPCDLLRACQSPEATAETDPQTLSTTRNPLYLGIAFEPGGKHSVCWTLESRPDLTAATPSAQRETPDSPPPSRVRGEPVFVTREILLLENLSIPEQIEALLPRARHARRVWLDATGAGDAAAQRLARRLGCPVGPSAAALSPAARFAAKLQHQPCTPALQNELFPCLQAALQSGQVLLPHHPCILEQLPALQAVVSDTRQVDYRARRAASHGNGGSAEYPAALALALRAALDIEFHLTSGATVADMPPSRSRSRFRLVL